MENSLTNFNPEQSAELLKGKLQSFNKMTVEIVEELFKARKYYGNQGFRSDLGQDCPKLNTFESYTEYIGLPKRTANSWLERYVPEQNKLLSFEEFQEKKQLQEIKKQSAEEQFRSILMEYRKTGKKLEGWTDRHEKIIIQDAKNEEIAKENAKKVREQMQRENEEKQQERQRSKIVNEAMDYATENLFNQINKRREWQDKIRLSDSGKEDSFNQAIVDYMETLPDDNRRIEACNNIIKICRNISVELQRKKI